MKKQQIILVLILVFIVFMYTAEGEEHVESRETNPSNVVTLGQVDIKSNSGGNSVNKPRPTYRNNPDGSFTMTRGSQVSTYTPNPDGSWTRVRDGKTRTISAASANNGRVPRRFREERADQIAKQSIEEAGLPTIDTPMQDQDVSPELKAAGEEAAAAVTASDPEATPEEITRAALLAEAGQGDEPAAEGGAAPAEGAAPAAGAAETPAQPTGLQRNINGKGSGTKFLRTDPGTYNSGEYEVTIGTDADGNTIYTVDYHDRRPTETLKADELKADSAFAKDMQGLEDNEALAKDADGEGDAGVTATESGDGKKPATPAEPTELDWGDQVLNAIHGAGGWFNFITGGPFTNNFATLGASWFGEGEDVYDLGSVGTALVETFSINEMVSGICEDKLIEPGGTNAVLTSASGRSYAHMEGERTWINPCLGVVDETENESCEPFYLYKISGEISAAEVPIDVEIRMKGVDGEVYLYPDEETLELELGERLSLSGAEMFIWETVYDYDQICMNFKNYNEIRSVFRAVIGADETELCQEIVDAYERDYQQFETEKGPSRRPSPRPTPARPEPIPGGAADEEEEEERPGLTAG
jgi:hypothetical protein